MLLFNIHYSTITDINYGLYLFTDITYLLQYIDLHHLFPYTISHTPSRSQLLTSRHRSNHQLSIDNQANLNQALIINRQSGI